MGDYHLIPYLLRMFVFKPKRYIISAFGYLRVISY